MTDNAFEFDVEDEGFDPFAMDFDDDDEGGDRAPRPSDPGVNPNPVAAPRVDARPAAERLAELLERMGAQRRTCLGVLRFCDEAQTSEAVRERVAQLQTGNASVFDAGGICTLLERAGGLERVDAEGGPYMEPTEDTLQTEVVDGVEYLAPAPEAAPPCWRTTEAGRAAVEADDPQARLSAALAADEAYLSIYRRILEAASADGGVAVKTLIATLDRDPLLQKPRRSCTAFVERLRDAEALEWRGAWVATDAGRALLARLAE